MHFLLAALLFAPYTPALRTPGLTCKAFDANGAEVPRSSTRKRLFWKMTNYPTGRPGFAVNHIVPLACGGCDVPSNMEWMTIEEWKKRTGLEREDCGRHAAGSWK